MQKASFKQRHTVVAHSRSTEKEKEADQEEEERLDAAEGTDSEAEPESSASSKTLAKSSVDKIELQARSAIDRLKDVLYKLNENWRKQPQLLN